MQRIEALKKLLKQERLDAYIVDRPVDLYYLLGEQFSLGRLLVTPEGEALFVDPRYIEAAKKLGVTSVLTAGYGPGSAFAQKCSLKGKRVGFAASYTTFDTYQELSFLEADLIPSPSLVARLRMVKEAVEIEKLQKAADLCRLGYEYLIGELKEGVTELELVQKLQIFWLERGGEGPGFDPIIAFGENGAYPHYHPQNVALKKGMGVLIDIGVQLAHYQSDMTRVVFFGSVDPKLKEIYSIVYQAQRAALEAAVVGAKLREVDDVARSFIKKAGYGEAFGHGLGHGLGLEVHEGPRLTYRGDESLGTLEEGMVVTIEPGIYLPSLGGVRLEDSVVITKKGPYSLTKIPLSETAPCIE